MTQKSITQQTDFIFKVIIVGDSGCGKSCLIQRYLTNEFKDEYNVTLGVQYNSKIVKIDNNVNVKLHFWDTAGQQAFKSLVKNFYRNSSAVVLAYNITKRISFENIQSWYYDALQNSPEDAIYILIGTHLDKTEDRQVQVAEAESWMRENAVDMFFQTSAKSSENVAKAFQQVAKQLFLNKINKGKDSDEKRGMKLGNNGKEDSFCC